MSQTFKFLYDNSATITHTAALVLFDSGTASLRDLALDGMFFADFSSSIDATWSGGTGTGTATGGAAVSGGQLDLTGATNQYVSYTAVDNADSQQVGTVQVGYEPGYTGSPAADRPMFTISKAAGDSDNLIFMDHRSTGQLRVQINDSTGASIFATDFGAYAPTAGVEDEIELNYDITTGNTEVFVNGTQLGGADVSTGTRDSSIALLRIGNDVTAAGSPDAKFDNFVVFAVVRHTANYTAGADAEEIPATKPGYSTNNPKLVLPGTFQADDLLSFTSDVTVTAPDEIRHILLDDGVRKYFNGSIWLNSDGSYAQSNTGADINTNIGLLDVGSALTLETFLHSDTGATTPSIISASIGFELEFGEPARPADCLVFGWIFDQKNLPIGNVEVRVTTPGLYHGSHAVLGTGRTTKTDVNGRWELLLMETATLFIHPYLFRFKAESDLEGDGASVDSTFSDIQVPNTEKVNFKDIRPLTSTDNSTGFTPTDAEKIAAVKNLVLEQGGNFELTITVKDTGGSPVNLTSVTEVVMDFRKIKEAQTTILSISLSGAEISIPTPANGEIIISVDDSVTDDLKEGGFYDMELTDFPSAGKKKRLMEGNFAVTQETTR